MTETEADRLVDQWEEVYKKGLLTFWLLLLLNERPMYAFEMGQTLREVSGAMIQADERSLYRALRRFEQMSIVASDWQSSDVGPQRRYYRLTDLGRELLRRFTERNILIFQKPDIAARIDQLFQYPSTPRNQS